jgi:hypothetical protein
MANNIATCTAWIIVVAIISGSILYGCHESRDSYYQAQSACVAAGGSWMVRGQHDGYDADCIRFAR